MIALDLTTYPYIRHVPGKLSYLTNPAVAGLTMYIHCTCGLGSHPVPKWNIRITFGLGSEGFSPRYPKSSETHPSGHRDIVRMVWFTLMNVHVMYGSVRTMYVQVHTYIVQTQTKYSKYSK